MSTFLAPMPMSPEYRQQPQVCLSLFLLSHTHTTYAFLSSLEAFGTYNLWDSPDNEWHQSRHWHRTLGEASQHKLISL
jgi:hypothetical protein